MCAKAIINLHFALACARLCEQQQRFSTFIYPKFRSFFFSFTRSTELCVAALIMLIRFQTCWDNLSKSIHGLHTAALTANFEHFLWNGTDEFAQVEKPACRSSAQNIPFDKDEHKNQFATRCVENFDYFSHPPMNGLI